MKPDEFIKNFSETYNTVYEYKWDDDLEQLTLFYSKTDISSALIRINLKGTLYDIYREFLYEDCYSHSMILQITKDEMFFCECFKQVFGKVPEISYEDRMGCPFWCDLVGFFNRPFLWDDFIHLLTLFEKAYHQTNSLTIDEIDKDSILLLSYRELQPKALLELKEFAPNLCNTHIKDSSLNKNHCFDSVCAYVNITNTTLTGVGTEYLVTLDAQLSDEQCYHIYAGIQYFILRSRGDDNRVIVVDKRLVDEIIELFESANEDWDVDSLCHYSIDKHSRLVITCGDIWAIVLPIRAKNYETCFAAEKNKIKSLQQNFVSVAPGLIWNRTYNFAMLNDKEFETLCRDLLAKMNFQNIQVRGRTRAPDGGVDIIADEEFSTLIGTEKRRWIFQCKHMKEQVNRKDLSEVEDLLQEFHANCYGLFYSGYFTPNTLDRIETIQRNKKFKIQGWDFNGLEILLTKFPEISLKYFGL